MHLPLPVIVGFIMCCTCTETVCWWWVSGDVWSRWEDPCLVLSQCLQYTQLLSWTHRVCSFLQSLFTLDLTLRWQQYLN